MSVEPNVFSLPGRGVGRAIPQAAAAAVDRPREGCGVRSRAQVLDVRRAGHHRHCARDRLSLGFHALDVGARMEGDRRPRLRRRSTTTSSCSATSAFWSRSGAPSGSRCWRPSFRYVLGVWAALVFHREFPFRGILRTVFVMPMMATPVAVALVWTMMFHPQLGVLNYLLSLVGIAPFAWVYDPATVIPTLVLVEVWHWTPLVMLIVLGGLAGLPSDPYEAALIDGASPLADVSLHHLAADPALRDDRARHSHHRQPESVRYDCRDLAGRPGHRIGDAQLFSLSPGLPVLQPRLRLGRGRHLLRHHHRAVAVAALPAPAAQSGWTEG